MHVGTERLREDLGSFLSVTEDDPPLKTSRNSRPPPEDASPELRALLDRESAKKARRATRSKTVAASTFNHALEEVEEMIESGDWEKCRARHLVALYDKMHQKCYGIEAVELGSRERYIAATMASRLTKDKFGGDFVKTVEFMRWVWTREIKKERWRRETGRETVRIGYLLMFRTTSYLLGDYRLAQQREQT